MNLRNLAMVPFAFAIACAQGGVDAPDSGDVGLGSDTTITSADTGGDPNNMPGDMATPNSSTGVCVVNDQICVDEQTLGRCRPDQTGYDTSPCPTDTTCLNGVCTTAPVCTPGSLDCLDDLTVLRCRQTGEGYIQMTCEPPLHCGEGMCTDKLIAGSGCTTDADCASLNCRCGSGTDDNCPASLGGGICANTSCTTDSCGVSGFCLASAEIPTGGADYDHCVRSCDAQKTCPTGSKCVAVPVHADGGGTEFRDACYFTGVKGFGDDCSADAECLTGACLKDYFSNGFCSRRCDADGFCSEGSACVQLVSGQYWCTLTCGDGSVVGTDPCPLDVPTDRFDVTCKNLPAQGGGVMRVCAAP